MTHATVLLSSLGAFFTSLITMFLVGTPFIHLSKQLFRSEVRPYTPENHKKKNDTPTMGGLLIITAAIISLLAWCDLSKPDVWLFILTLVSFGSIGLVDDLGKIWYKSGISALMKSNLQIGTSIIVGLLWLFSKFPSSSIHIPLFNYALPIWTPLLLIWIIFILVGTSNAVNLTDGLDGLAASNLSINYLFFGIVAFVITCGWVHVSCAPNGELVIIASALLGASLGFLWFNAHPATIFMGDVGSLALGAVLGLLAIMSRMELLLAISGGIFVMETMSVIIQKISWKYRKQRIFKMSPIHHHFEMIGWHESKITVRFTIISILLSAFAMILLFL